MFQGRLKTLDLLPIRCQIVFTVQSKGWYAFNVYEQSLSNYIIYTTLSHTFSGHKAGIFNSSATNPTGLGVSFPFLCLRFGGCVTTPTTSNELYLNIYDDPKKQNKKNVNKSILYSDTVLYSIYS